MKVAVLFALSLFVMPVFAAQCPLTGTFEITGKFNTLGKWTFELKDGKLVTSFTDDLSAQEFPTLLMSPGEGDERFIIENTEFGSDAVLRRSVYFSYSCEQKGVELYVNKGYETIWEADSDVMNVVEGVKVKRIK
jgi:hypothetical protein